MYKLLGFFLCLVFIGCANKNNKSTDTSQPNIVIIYTDDQGYGDLSVLNPEAKFSTPNMDRIANEGATFTDGHSSDAVCTPSRYSLLTGRYSWRTSLKKGVLKAKPNDHSITFKSEWLSYCYDWKMAFADGSYRNQG